MGVEDGLAERQTAPQTNQITTDAVDPQHKSRWQSVASNGIAVGRGGRTGHGDRHRLDGLPGPRARLAGLGVVRREGQHLLGQLDHFAPAARVRGLVQPDEQGRETVAVPFEIGGQLFQHLGPIVQAATDSFDRVEGQNELAAIGQLARLQPVVRRFFEDLHFRRPHTSLAQTGNGLVGSSRLPGVQERPNLGDPQPDQGLTETSNAFFRRLQLFGCQHIAPGGLGVVELELAFPVFDVAAGELSEEAANGAMVADGGLGQQAMGLFQTPLLRRFSRLSNCQPREAEHFLYSHPVFSRTVSQDLLRQERRTSASGQPDCRRAHALRSGFGFQHMRSANRKTLRSYFRSFLSMASSLSSVTFSAGSLSS